MTPISCQSFSTNSIFAIFKLCATVSADSAGGMQGNMAILYTLLLNLTSASYGKNYTDPVERTEAGSYSELCRSDASFKQETEDCKKAIDDLITAHGTYKSGTGSISAHNFDGYFSRNTGTNGKTYLECITGAEAGDDGVKSAKLEIANYKDGIKNRISEISNRIGYLNGKDTASGGGYFLSVEVDYLLLNGTDPSSTDEGDNVLYEDADLVQMESEVSASIGVGSAGDGFAGYTFNGGSGYANTIYSHCNFLAGKKIQLIAKILKAVESVTDIYNQIKAKRAEYYEYNQ